MNHLKIISSTTVLGAIILVASCTSNKEIDKPISRIIEFTTVGVDTRGETTPDNNYELFADGSKLGVLAYQLPDGVFDPTVNTPDLLYNAELTKVSTGNYTYNPLANWPDAGKVKFFAYHPHSSTFPSGTIGLSSFNSSGYPVITIDLQKASGKLDFSVAELAPITPFSADDPTDGSIPPRDDYYVNFRFKRQLSELFFRAKAVDMPTNVNLYIHQIAIKNASKKGSYNFLTKSWTPEAPATDGTSGATIAFGSVGMPIDKNKYVDIINPNNTDGKNRDASVVMIPSRYEVVMISLLYTLEYMKPEGGCEYRIVGSKYLPLTVDWKPSTMYTYDIDCGYYEAVGDSTKLSFKVSSWIKNDVNTEIN